MNIAEAISQCPEHEVAEVIIALCRRVGRIDEDDVERVMIKVDARDEDYVNGAVELHKHFNELY